MESKLEGETVQNEQGHMIRHILFDVSMIRHILFDMSMMNFILLTTVVILTIAISIAFKRGSFSGVFARITGPVGDFAKYIVGRTHGAWSSISAAPFPTWDIWDVWILIKSIFKDIVNIPVKAWSFVVGMYDGFLNTGDFSVAGGNLKTMAIHFFMVIFRPIIFTFNFLLFLIHVLAILLLRLLCVLLWCCSKVMSALSYISGYILKVPSFRVLPSSDSIIIPQAVYESFKIPSDILDNGFFEQILKNYIARARDPRFMEDFTGFWAATKPEYIPKKVRKRLATEEHIDGSKPYRCKTIPLHARNHYTVSPKVFLIFEESYNYLKKLASSDELFGIDIEKLQGILALTGYKNTSSVNEKFLREISSFLKRHEPFESLFTKNRGMYYKLVAFLKIYTLWTFICERDAYCSEHFDKKSGTTKPTILYDNTDSIPDLEGESQGISMEQCDSELRDLNDFVLKDKLNKTSYAYLLKALDLRVIEVLEDESSDVKIEIKSPTLKEGDEDEDGAKDEDSDAERLGSRELIILETKKGPSSSFSKIFML